MLSTDSMITRIALSLWSSGKRVEPLPVVRVFEPYQTCDLVPLARCGWGTARDPMNEAL